jgi:hypothetical protein
VGVLPYVDCNDVVAKGVLTSATMRIVANERKVAPSVTLELFLLLLLRLCIISLSAKCAALWGSGIQNGLI